MPVTSASVLLQAANHLNDPSQLVYTPTVLVPFLNMALQELEEELAVYEITPLIKEDVTVNIAINAIEVTLPNDFRDAISLIERPQGATDSEYIEVKEVADLDNNLNVNKTDSLLQWALRNNRLFINPPRTAREVILTYLKGLTEATDSNNIDIEITKFFLGLVTARNAAVDLGNSPNKANTYTDRISRSRDRLIRRLQKGSQSTMGVRRKPYTGRGR